MNFLTNWKTTALGIAAILTAGGHLLSSVAAGDFSSLAVDGGVIITGVMGLVAKDANVTGGTTPQ
jgi:hypothetical protein